MQWCIRTSLRDSKNRNISPFALSIMHLPHIYYKNVNKLNVCIIQYYRLFLFLFSYGFYKWFFSVFDSQNFYHLKVQFKINVNSEKFTVKWTIKAIEMATKKNLS